MAVSQIQGTQGNKNSKIESELTGPKKEQILELTRKVDSNLIQDQTHSLIGSQQGAIELLRKQLEFYFGDPNLSKDNFMRGLIAKNPKGYVELKTLLGFHKIGQILNAHSINKFEERLNSLRQAIKISEILKLCKQNLRVKRKIPFDMKHFQGQDFIEELNSRTIYIENIPLFANQELVAKVYAKYGRILHVGLPKEGENKKKKNKGFAFIEFEVYFCNKDQGIGYCFTAFKQQHTKGVYV